MGRGESTITALVSRHGGWETAGLAESLRQRDPAAWFCQWAQTKSTAGKNCK